MKKSKILVPALAMLVMSTAATVTGTVAWFSMNTAVRATGMTVTAKSESTFLVISKTSTLATLDEIDLGVSGTLLPVSYTTSAIADKVTANNWFSASGETTTNGAAKTGSQTQLTISEASNKGSVSTKDYYVFNSFYIGLAEGSAAVETGKGIQADVTFNATKSSNLNKCLTCYVVYGDSDDPSSAATTQKYVYDAASGSKTVYSTALQEDSVINTTSPTKVTVYLFFDGENENCTTANAINLDSISVSIAFTVNEAIHTGA
ncbi:MAG: hypothetical protein MJZ37_04210 [Bacilli bacterium]|nr:hypothetical protein [Bacilli bacterium]